MQLAQYMKDNDLNDRQLSERLGVSRVSITHYRTGKRFPKPEILISIHDYTKGQVTPMDFLSGLERME